MEISPLTKKQLEQRLLTLHQASLELVQDISIDSLLEKLASLACKEAEAQYGAVIMVNDKKEIERFIPVGMNRVDVDEVLHTPQGRGLIGVLMNSKEPIRVANISDDPRSYGFPVGHPQMSSFLGVPVCQGELTLGYIFLTNKVNSQEFTDDDRLIIEMLASYASASITNARLYKDLIQRDRILTRRNEDLALLDELASTLATSTDISQILDKGLSQLMDYLRLEAGEIYLRQNDTKNLVLKVHKGNASNNLWKRNQYILGESIVGQTAKSGNPVLLDLSEGDYDEMDPSVKSQGIHQVAVVPLTGRRGVMGTLCVATCHPQPLDDLEVQFLQAIGSWMATAIENVRLNVQDRRLAVLEERERIGMDLHDGIIQSIYAVGLTLEHARLLMQENPEQSKKRIEQAIKDLNATIRDIRAYILDLRPRQLHNEDLMSGISRLVAEFRANTLLDVNLQGPNEDISHLPKNQAVSLFHICQEALANIAKHAHAHKVDVVVWTTNDRLLLEIRDDGEGFNTDSTKSSIGHGLSNMETRVQNAGGEVDITSEPGKGTSIFAWVPFAEDESLVVE
jgi:two-component system, NarL family, sensor histidine kinase DevS